MFGEGGETFRNAGDLGEGKDVGAVHVRGHLAGESRALGVALGHLPGDDRRADSLVLHHQLTRCRSLSVGLVCTLGSLVGSSVVSGS